MNWRARGEWRASRIGLRLLAFNVLVVFVPIVGIRYLDVYEDRLLEAQERSMVQQARVLAAAVGGSPTLDVVTAQGVVHRIGRRSDARLRIFDHQGVLLADSARGGEQPQEEEAAGRSQASPSGVRQRILYRIGALIIRTRAQISIAMHALLGTRAERTSAASEPHERSGATGTPASEGVGGAGGAKPPGKETTPGPGQPETLDVAVKAALAGRYGATTQRTSGQRSLTLFTAIPVRHQGEVTGAVVVSQSTFRILQALYDIRLRIFQIVLASLAVAALLTTVAAMTIVRPLTRLRRAAGTVSGRHGPLPAAFPGTERKDEIGELARALEGLKERLSGHIALLEGFAADVSHEFKNPLAGIRAAAETIDDCDDPAERQRFVHLLTRDVGRLERLVSGVRELARIDGQLEQGAATSVDVGELVRTVADHAGTPGARNARVVFSSNGQPCRTRGDRESLAQVFENLLSNAVSFAPDGTTVEVSVRRDASDCLVTVADRGPGIPEAHLPRLFERFFAYRPEDARREHLGLGLAIAKRIADGHGGSIAGANRPGGGASFELRLPAIDK